MKIVFMGTPDYAKVVLSALYEKFEILAVFTQPDKPVGRKMIMTPPPVKVFATEHEIAVFQPQCVRECAGEIKALKPDFIVVAAYGQILNAEILDIAPCINLHASILPAFRGASPIQDMILKGQKINGVTAMKMGVGLDDGDMLGFICADIGGKNAGELFDEFAKMAGILAVKTLENYDKISAIPQFDCLSSKCRKIKKENGLISFNDDIKTIWRKFLAFSPWPGVFLENGTKLLNLRILEGNAQIGKICAINKESFCVGASGGILEILELQEAGKKALCAKDYINGKRLELGSNFNK